jgi:hypothetical protein
LGERQELEKQEIYCASLAELNDPMEGFKDLIWSGDKMSGGICSSIICFAWTMHASCLL